MPVNDPKQHGSKPSFDEVRWNLPRGQALAHRFAHYGLPEHPAFMVGNQTLECSASKLSPRWLVIKARVRNQPAESSLLDALQRSIEALYDIRTQPLPLRRSMAIRNVRANPCDETEQERIKVQLLLREGRPISPRNAGFMLSQPTTFVDERTISDVLDCYIEDLGQAVEELVSKFTGEDIATWLGDNTDEWMNSAGLAAVVEAGTRIFVPGLERAILRILQASQHAHPMVVDVAAQRLRLLHVSDSAVRQKLSHALRGLIDTWRRQASEDGEQSAMIALPSVPYVAGREVVQWLVDIIREGQPRLAWAAALGTLDWASGRCTETEPLDDVAKRTLSRAIVERLSREQNSPAVAGGFQELLPTLVWVLGATATEEVLIEVAAVLVSAFEKPRRIEDAAAIRAGKLLVRRFGEKGSEALADAFGGERSRFLPYFTLAAL